MLITDLARQNLIHPPKWMPANTVMLVTMGSQAYGVSNDDSDMDVYGVCMPPKELVFPHLAGEIPGFGRQIQRFDIWQEHHIKDPSGKVEYDFAVYGIVKYFQLCMENNPNMIDTLFVPQECITHINHIGQMIRENRKSFLHKGSYYKFLGYANSSLHKMNNKKVAKKEVKKILAKLENTNFSLEQVEFELKGRGINF